MIKKINEQNEVLEAMALLYLESNRIEVLERQLNLAYKRADRKAVKVVNLENRYVNKYKESPYIGE